MPAPIITNKENVVEIHIDATLYSVEAITATLYKYTNHFHVFQSHDQAQGDNMILVSLESKDNNVIRDTVVKEFFDDLVDQQLRVDIEKQFGHIRNLIVEEAFKPLNK